VLAALAFFAASFDVTSVGTAQAAEPKRLFVPVVPAGDLENVDFFLITAGIGEDLASRFGHTGIRIRDGASGTDAVYNWGTFAFDEGSFAWKFFRGNVTYRLGVRTFEADVRHFSEEGRRIVQQALNLTPSQKRKLYEKIAWNAKPENRSFPYQYWFKNCATIPRDYLDEVLDGQVRARYFAQPGHGPFRSYVRTYLARIPFVAPLLDIMMNGNIDRPITAWEEMFLPESLRSRLSAMTAVDDKGEPMTGSPLLGEVTVLADNPESYAAPVPDYFLLAAPTLVPLVLAAGLWLARRRRAALRALGVATMGWALVSGALGTTLLLNWGFSGHPDGFANVNLLLFFPFDLVVLPVGWRLLRTGATQKDRYPFPMAVRYLTALHFVAATLLALLATTGVVTQDVSRVLVWYGTTMVWILVGLSAVGLTTWSPARVPADTAAASSGAPLTSRKLSPRR
jgi:hypothetical protein